MVSLLEVVRLNLVVPVLSKVELGAAGGSQVVVGPLVLGGSDAPLGLAGAGPDGHCQRDAVG